MKKLQEIFEKLAQKIEEIRALCPDILDLYVPGAEEALENLKKVIEILADPVGAVDKHTAGFNGARAEQMLELLSKYERKFLQSLVVSKMVRNRIVEKIQNEVYLGRMTVIEHVFDAWDSLRGVGTTDELRTAYNKLISVIESAEEASVEYRLRMALAPAQVMKATRVRKRTSQSTNVGPTTPKGPVGQKADKNGGFGTSRKSVQKRRRRKPKAGQAKQQAA